ncbi:MAG TPA: AAA family ATPase, partial [Actinomycetota bacterium]|nr:AAA family ATPase [Actinomycetota bacterium]
MDTPALHPATIGELRASGYLDRTVKEELRQNLLTSLAAGEALFPSIVGFDDSVIPALERGILAGHDVILLGERGQAKTRLIRHLVDLLDDSMPVIAGCEVNDHPFRPICARCRARVAEQGDAVGIDWLPRDRRYAEKLATPDTSVADLIGDVDPIRVAEGRYLSDELTIHYGLIPRTHRGIVAINELPDLPERIQVSLFNILEERDVQIRGYRIQLPLDLLLVATANPEDYTNRGRIVSPLKDRFGTQVRTHYPESLGDEIAIMDQEARSPAVLSSAGASGALSPIPVRVPPFMKEILAALTAELRRSPHVNHRSGVSVRYSIGNLETAVASAIRRAARGGEPEAVPRVVDLPAVLAGSLGRVEFDAVEEGRAEEILLRAAKGAVLDVFRRRLSGFDFAPILAHF